MIVSVSKDRENAWAELCVALWPENNTIDSFLQERAANILENEFLYLIDDNPVAFMSLSLRHDYVEGTSSSPVGYLEGIYVKPEFRNKGIARELIEYAKKWSVQNGCAEFASDCSLDNEISRVFHNKIGFTEANKIVCFTMQLRTE